MCLVHIFMVHHKVRVLYVVLHDWERFHWSVFPQHAERSICGIRDSSQHALWECIHNGPNHKIHLNPVKPSLMDTEIIMFMVPRSVFTK